ncbi:mannose-6-phosphate isomerase, class I [Alteribacter populi]|uniref:mannose-6-phosphate isomerase, class I n=1 Tax=Alteribacter populi TaxID=2011011 RepID=UPI000BBAB299|nr:mannose-6-phosphate isomerase, class I [Alteribacter populi]
MKGILFLEPVFKEKIWGGSGLRSQFDYEIPSNSTGECWGISGHENGTNIVANGVFKGKTLRQLWNENRELFNHEPGEEFPLLVKIIDAQDDLSVQVHPDDEYAKKHEGYALGKTECWYILDHEPGAKLVLGHHANSRDELTKMVDAERWGELFRDVPVQKGDFYYVPSGTVHAIGKGIMILEIQQSSDITYRFYDYGRTDDRGNPRELHIDDSIACSMVPHKDALPEQNEWTNGDLMIKKLIEENYFTVYRWDIAGEASYKVDQYLLMSVVDGQGEIIVEGVIHKLEKGQHFIVPSTVDSFTIRGKMTMTVSHTTK